MAAHSRESAFILKQRAEELAKPVEVPRQSFRSLDVLIFTLGGEQFGIDLEYVIEVVPIEAVTRVPCTPDFVLGVSSYHGSVLPLLDLRALLDLEVSLLPDGAQAVVVTVDGMTFGLGVDTTTGVVQLEEGALVAIAPSATGKNHAFIRNVTGQMAGVLDVKALCRSERIVVKDEA